MENTHKKNKGVSVIICCYNSAERLPETLRHISKQKYLDNTSWELIIVNNNSTDNTAEVAERCWLEYGSTTVLKLINEPSPGLTNARIAGIKNSSYEYIIFCDDDNWLGPSYLYNVIKLLNNRSNIGIVGPSKMEAVYESPKPKWLEGHEHLLCVYDKKQNEIIINKNDTIDLLAGAGMGVRKKILIQYLDEIEKNKQRLVLDRSPLHMLSGGDVDICLVALKLGYNLLYTNELNLKHFIPAFKLKKQYLLRLYEGMAYSNVLLNHFNEKPLPKEWTMPGLAKHILVHCFGKPFKLQLLLSGIKGRRKGMNFLSEKIKTIQE